MDVQHQGLVHIAPALVGPPDTGLLLRRLRPHHRAGGRSRRSARSANRKASGRTRTCWTPGSPPGSGPSRRSAGRTRPRRSKKYYPTSVLVTAFDIIFFWVARMIMMGLEVHGRRALPRRLHPRPRTRRAGRQDEQVKGKRHRPARHDGRSTAPTPSASPWPCSRRRGGTSSSPRNGSRDTATFCNKIWNATRFILMNLGDDFTERELDAAELEPFDRWILHRLTRRSARHRRGNGGVQVQRRRPRASIRSGGTSSATGTSS